MSLKRSVNIKYDFSDNSIIDGYIGTKSHTQIVKTILNGVLGNEVHSHIAYGPYGAGKSYISTIMMNLLTGNFTDYIKKLEKEFGWFDNDIISKLRELKNTNKIKFLPVILNGYELDFEQAILKNIRSVLKENNISFRTRNSIKVIESHINNWKENFKDVYNLFRVFLEKNAISENDFLTLLETDEFPVEKFEEFYRTVSAGALLTLYNSDDLIEVLEDLSNYLLPKNLGIFIVYDEFGRYLQNLDDKKISKFFGLLQNLAEYTNKSKNTCLLLITHKPIIHYFNNQSSELKAEFAKIEQRFSINEIKSDYETFVKIALSVIQEIKNAEISESEKLRQLEYTNKFTILNKKYVSTNDHSVVIKMAYPIHPVALLLLPEFSSVFGQNERTLFTFLLDTSNSGLSGYISKNSGFYYADQLVDYFFNGTEDKYNENLREVTLFKKLYATLSTIFAKTSLVSAQRILKFCLVWNITRSNNIYPLNSELISYSLDIPLDEVDKCIRTFKNHKMIRHNIRKKYLELYEASSVNVEELINKAKVVVKEDKKTISETLNKYNPIKYIYPTEYNLINDTIRFASVKLALNGSDFQTHSIACDFNINILVSQSENIPEFVKKGSSLNGFLYVKEYHFVKNNLLTLAAVEHIIRNQTLYDYDQLLNVELEYIKYEAQEFLQKLFINVFSVRTMFFHQGTTVKLISLIEVEKLVNIEITKTYKNMLVIHNDQINKFTITRQQETATIQLINEILVENTNKFEYKFADKGPKYLLHYAINHAENIAEIKNKLEEHLIQFENGALSDLIVLLTSPPFGIRPTLAPLVLVYSLIDKWKNIMFFKDGDYVPKLTSQYIYDAGIGKYDCNYNYSDFDFKNQKLLEFIIEIFGLPNDGTKDKSLSIRTCSSLYNWYINLPTIIQLGYSNSIEENKFLKLIELSKSNPRKSLSALSERFINTDDLSTIKVSLENRFRQFLESLDKSLRDEFEIESWSLWGNSQTDLIKRSNELVSTCLTNADLLVSFAKTFEELEITKWPKSMFEVLKSNIRNEYDKIKSKLKTSEIIINGKVISVYEVDLSPKALNLKKNILSAINANERYISKAEIEKLLLILVDEYLK